MPRMQQHQNPNKPRWQGQRHSNWSQFQNVSTYLIVSWSSSDQITNISPLKTNISLKIDGWKINFPFLFRGHVNFLGGKGTTVAHHLQPKVLLAAVFVTALVTALEGTTFAVALALDLNRWKMDTKIPYKTHGEFCRYVAWQILVLVFFWLGRGGGCTFCCLWRLWANCPNPISI